MPQLLLATPAMAAEYSDWFVNRRAYTLQSDWPHPESGRHYYYRPGSKAGAEVPLQPRRPAAQPDPPGGVPAAAGSYEPSNQEL